MWRLAYGGRVKHYFIRRNFRQYRTACGKENLVMRSDEYYSVSAPICANCDRVVAKAAVAKAKANQQSRGGE